MFDTIMYLFLWGIYDVWHKNFIDFIDVYSILALDQGKGKNISPKSSPVFDTLPNLYIQIGRKNGKMYKILVYVPVHFCNNSSALQIFHLKNIWYDH